MPNPQPQSVVPGVAQSSVHHAADDYPVREYIGSMAHELAQMARGDGDEALSVLLSAAADRAGRRAAAA